MATNYYNVLDKPLGLSKDSIGRLVYSETTPHASIELGNTLAGILKSANVANIYNLETFTGVATFTTDSLATGADALGAATLNSLPAKSSGGFIYVGANIRFGKIVVDIANANGTDNTLAVEYYDESTGAWTAVADLTDGTVSGADSFAQDGTIEFTIPSNWNYGKLTDIASAADSVVNATTRYFWVRLSWNAAFDSATSTNSILPNIGMTDYSPTHVGLEIVNEWAPGHSDATLVECIDATAVSGNVNHTGVLQAIGAALLWRDGSRTCVYGAALSAWPTYSIGANVTITTLYGLLITNTGTISASATLTNYTGVLVGAMTKNVTTNWYGLHIGAYSGTAVTAYGIYIDAVASAGTNSAGIVVNSPTAGGTKFGIAVLGTTASYGLYVAGGVLAGIAVNAGGIAVVAGGISITAGRLRDTLSITDVDAQNNTLTVAQIVAGIVMHTSVTGGGTVTTDTAANIIAGSAGVGALTANGMSIVCYYINDGSQTLTFAGGTDVTVSDTGNTILTNEAATVVFRRTSGTTVSCHII